MSAAAVAVVATSGERTRRKGRRGVIMVALCNRETIYIFMLWFVLLMVALCNRADHYIFVL